MKTPAEKTLLVLTAVSVGGLAIAAGAVSFAHMRELAAHHDQLGWKSYAFPVSVDGLEIVASLYLVAQRRAGRSPGWIPWVALIVGTLASLAANMAVGGSDPIGKALAGWPALSMLVSVKLLFSMFDHEGVNRAMVVRDDQRTSGTVQISGQDDVSLSLAVPAPRTNALAPFTIGPVAQGSNADQPRHEPGSGNAARSGGSADLCTPADICTVERLILAARAAHAALVRTGRSLSRDNLADAMRNDGHGVSNARASLLLKLLKAEQGLPAVGSAPPSTVPSRSTSSPDAVS